MLTPESFYSKAHELDIDLALEPFLIPLVHEALIAPLPPHWTSITSSRYTNQLTREEVTTRPTHDYYLSEANRIRMENQDGASTGWVAFGSQDTKYYYDFVTQREQSKRPNAVVHNDDNLPVQAEADPQTFVHAPLIHAKPSYPKIEELDILCFHSWWNESTQSTGTQRRSLCLYFSVSTGQFQVIIDDSDHCLTISHLVTLVGQRLVTAWDLYVGARLSVLGKKTTLRQASSVTRQWLLHHEGKFSRVKDRLRQELLKCDPKHSREYVYDKNELKLAKDTICLRSILKDIQTWQERLACTQPQVAAKLCLPVQAHLDSFCNE